MSNNPIIDDKTICFGEKLASSSSFKSLFKEGMGLVEETAAYLDGEGREEAKRLPRLHALTYASESMRLTTRLMQLASWLLLQRAVNEGEISQAEALSDKRRTRVSWQSKGTADAPDMPPRFMSLVERSLRLQERIARLDGAISAPRTLLASPFVARPIEQQMSRLRDAFHN
jgi:regulator of CtrA degradation